MLMIHHASSVVWNGDQRSYPLNVKLDNQQHNIDVLTWMSTEVSIEISYMYYVNNPNIKDQFTKMIISDCPKA